MRKILFIFFTLVVILFVFIAYRPFNPLAKRFSDLRVSITGVHVRRINRFDLRGMRVFDRSGNLGIVTNRAAVIFHKVRLLPNREIKASFELDNLRFRMNGSETGTAYKNAALKAWIDLFWKAVKKNELISMVVGPGQEYDIRFNVEYDGGEYFKIKGFEAVSKDIKISGDYEYQNKGDTAHIAVNISCSPVVIAKHNDIVKKYMLKPGDDGWYGLAYEVNCPYLFLKGALDLFVFNRK